VLVLDTRNTHRPAALWAAFPLAAAHRWNATLAWPSTPTQGKWLNMAEIAFSVLARQWRDRRSADKRVLKGAIARWQARRQQAGTGSRCPLQAAPSLPGNPAGMRYQQMRRGSCLWS